ncbi:tetratricopeptide repeat protein [Shimia sp. MMG029]|uniref:tetratricopeptide repeat protein n=1 Tax=Shimia sp. MMG029 TaxID=3021978 RepID=UPI0022FDF81D|nr:tetratricopeptide repeat protein [Shimia sp. MMG029]MDA5555777.1 tetratricopeptide repeat protein [Shimia sp. MMG029]
MTALANVDSGQPEKAIPVLLALLAQNPNLVRVRLELARAYFNAKDWSRARQEFFIVLSADLPAPVKERVLAFIRAIDNRRGFDWDLSLAVVKVGNQRRYADDTILVDSGGIQVPFTFDRERSDEFGLRAVGAFNFRKPLASLSTANTAASGFTTLAFDLTEAKTRAYDDALLSLAGGLRFTKQRLTYAVAPEIRTRYVAGAKYEDRVGLTASFESRGLEGRSVFARTTFFDITNARDSSLSGHIATASIGVRQAVGGRAIIGVTGRIERENVPNASQDALTTQITAFGTFEMKYGITAQPSLYYRFKNHKNPSPILPADPNQKTYGLRLRLEKNDWFIAGSYTPFFDISYENTRSDIGAFTYTETRSQIGVNRRF